MPRSIWSGAISFGMVSIPVKLYAATESKDIAFHLLHKGCRGRLKQLRWCPPCEREVPWEEVARGYEYAREEHVLLDEADFENLPLPSRRTIQLSAFVPIPGAERGADDHRPPPHPGGAEDDRLVLRFGSPLSTN